MQTTSISERQLSRWRWLFAVLLMLGSIINYVDRQALSLLAETIQKELVLTDVDYAWITRTFLLCYGVTYLLAGRMVDRYGERLSESAFMLWWSCANILTAWATGFHSLLFFRGLLGMGEPGHYSVAAKVVSNWFPPRERAIAVGMYTMGGTLGAAIAGPLVSTLALRFGWRMSFVLTGCMGVVLATIWYAVYRPNAATKSLPNLTPVPAPKPAAIPLREYFRWRPIWIVVAARLLTDPVWYFYLFWFPKFMQKQFHYSLADLGATIWIPFLAADAGCLLGGWASGALVKRGIEPLRARLITLGVCAGAMLSSVAIPWAGSGTVALILASIGCCAVMAFMTNCVALPIDIFPSSRLGTVQGIIGTGGSLGGFLSQGLIAWLISEYSYKPVFCIIALAHPLAFSLLSFYLIKFVEHHRQHVSSEETSYAK